MHYEFKADGRAGGALTRNCPRHRAGGDVGATCDAIRDVNVSLGIAM